MPPLDPSLRGRPGPADHEPLPGWPAPPLASLWMIPMPDPRHDPAPQALPTLGPTVWETPAEPTKAFERVLVGYDGSHPSRHALRWALALGSAGARRVMVLAVSEPGAALPPGLGAQVDDAARKARRAPSVHLLREPGRAADQVIRAARLGSADLVVVGSHSRRGFSRAHPPSVVDALLRHGAAGVLVAKGPPPAGRVLCASDGSPAATHALRVALRLAEAWNAPLDVLHVAAPPHAEAAMPQNAQHAELRPLARGVPVQSLLVAGEPGAAIVEVARRQHAGLLVIGSRGPSRLGSRGVGRRIVLDSPVSVLVARKPS